MLDSILRPLLRASETRRVQASVKYRADRDRAERRRPEQDEQEWIEPALQKPGQGIRAPL